MDERDVGAFPVSGVLLHHVMNKLRRFLTFPPGLSLRLSDYKSGKLHSHCMNYVTRKAKDRANSSSFRARISRILVIERSDPLTGRAEDILSFDIVPSSHPRHSRLRRTNNTMLSHVYTNFEVKSHNGWLPRVFIHYLMHYSLPGEP